VRGAVGERGGDDRLTRGERAVEDGEERVRAPGRIRVRTSLGVAMVTLLTSSRAVPLNTVPPGSVRRAVRRGPVRESPPPNIMPSASGRRRVNGPALPEQFHACGRVSRIVPSGVSIWPMRSPTIRAAPARHQPPLLDGAATTPQGVSARRSTPRRLSARRSTRPRR
jgi:hypothetical protein